MKDISISIISADYSGAKAKGNYGYVKKDKYSVCVCPECNMVFDNAHGVINYYLTGFPRYGAKKQLCARCKK